MLVQVQLAQRLAVPGDKMPAACSWTAQEVPTMPWLEYVPGRDTLIEADQLAAGLPSLPPKHVQEQTSRPFTCIKNI